MCTKGTSVSAADSTVGTPISRLLTISLHMLSMLIHVATEAQSLIGLRKGVFLHGLLFHLVSLAIVLVSGVGDFSSAWGVPSGIYLTGILNLPEKWEAGLALPRAEKHTFVHTFCLEHTGKSNFGGKAADTIAFCFLFPFQ